MAGPRSKPDASARLAELVMGSLTPEERAAVEAEVEASEDLQRELAELRDAVDVLGSSVEPVAPSLALRERVLDVGDPQHKLDGFLARMQQLFDVSSGRAREILATIGGASDAWTEPGPGLRVLHSAGGPSVASAHCGLVEVAPGHVFPEHGHTGDEWTLNLQGRAEEDSGLVFEPGDLVRRESGTSHSLRSIGDEPYIYAVVLHGELPGGVDPPDDLF